jgi:hypothetical protein
MDVTLKKYIDDVKLVAKDVVQAYVDKAKKLNADYFSFVRFHDDYIDVHLNEFA